MSKDERQPFRVEYSTLPRQAVGVKDLPYQIIASKSFWAGFFLGVALFTYRNGWPEDYYQLIGLALSGFAAGSVASAVITIAYISRATDRNFERDVVIREYELLPNAEAVRITGNGYTTEIRQPKEGAFARWAREVLNDESRVQFSQNEAETRGFDIRNVLGELNRVGALEGRADGNGVYRLNDNGKRLLIEWLS